MDGKEFTAASFYEFLAGHKLMGTRCTCDGAVFLPPRAYCPDCASHPYVGDCGPHPTAGSHGRNCQDGAMEWLEFSGKGKLLTFTIIYIGPAAMIAAGFDRKHPYCVGIVQLEEGPRISALITGVDPFKPETIAVGSVVSLDIQELGPAGAQKPVLAFHLNESSARVH